MLTMFSAKSNICFKSERNFKFANFLFQKYFIFDTENLILFSLQKNIHIFIHFTEEKKIESD